ncbi:hypothetical protein KFL_000520110 [Klebsormidium nitens]|uniref:Uncharacterized protein n=1 Tax=Klebsormidium nitens TaxID=105231 RepID=A0A1Y1HTK8_KLENI|nr:hypothetical protein KFL_000520110 [Klebsormidium nitens]|eukprot:GAQ80341.1 hypothetical protein KFL_000520110 [Klebsormidium nitens]
MNKIYTNGLFALDLERSVPFPENMDVRDLMSSFLESVRDRTGTDCHVDADQGLVVLSGSCLSSVSKAEEMVFSAAFESDGFVDFERSTAPRNNPTALAFEASPHPVFSVSITDLHKATNPKPNPDGMVAQSSELSHSEMTWATCDPPSPVGGPLTSPGVHTSEQMGPLLQQLAAAREAAQQFQGPPPFDTIKVHFELGTQLFYHRIGGVPGDCFLLGGPVPIEFVKSAKVGAGEDLQLIFSNHVAPSVCGAVEAHLLSRGFRHVASRQQLSLHVSNVEDLTSARISFLVFDSGTGKRLQIRSVNSGASELFSLSMISPGGSPDHRLSLRASSDLAGNEPGGLGPEVWEYARMCVDRAAAPVHNFVVENARFKIKRVFEGRLLQCESAKRPVQSVKPIPLARAEKRKSGQHGNAESPVIQRTKTEPEGFENGKNQASSKPVKKDNGVGQRDSIVVKRVCFEKVAFEKRAAGKERRNGKLGGPLAGQERADLPERLPRVASWNGGRTENQSIACDRKPAMYAKGLPRVASWNGAEAEKESLPRVRILAVLGRGLRRLASPAKLRNGGGRESRNGARAESTGKRSAVGGTVAVNGPENQPPQRSERKRVHGYEIGPMEALTLSGEEEEEETGSDGRRLLAEKSVAEFPLSGTEAEADSEAEADAEAEVEEGILVRVTFSSVVDENGCHLEIAGTLPELNAGAPTRVSDLEALAAFCESLCEMVDFVCGKCQTVLADLEGTAIIDEGPSARHVGILPAPPASECGVQIVPATDERNPKPPRDGIAEVILCRNGHFVGSRVPALKERGAPTDLFLDGTLTFARAQGGAPGGQDDASAQEEGARAQEEGARASGDDAAARQEGQPGGLLLVREWKRTVCASNHLQGTNEGVTRVTPRAGQKDAPSRPSDCPDLRKKGSGGNLGAVRAEEIWPWYKWALGDSSAVSKRGAESQDWRRSDS